jgi:septal ring factor EnvC (AmiA/AmiB activator)
MDGDIRYVGAFKGYGNMVIIEHSGGYHSLIAGFDTTTTSVGHRVTKGEPLGSLIKKSNFGAPRLYYELRRHGKVVDPAQKLSGVR